MSHSTIPSSHLDEATWPDRKVLIREMGLTTDEIEKAYHITHILKLLKNRKKHENRDESPAKIAADYYSIATHMFWNTFKTFDEFHFNEHSKVKWFLCKSHQKVTHSPSKNIRTHQLTVLDDHEPTRQVLPHVLYRHVHQRKISAFVPRLGLLQI
ncbi:hypothetical protein BDZ45DRAFT_675291 [Acephala macrosclerotiorum]|nr:hypothetical protein BDZ45DRAFT_675291 [Acephala macrosclerotiorum]